VCDHCGCRRFPRIAELTAEHEAILALGWELAERVSARRAVDPAASGRLLGLVRSHTAKEETGLYPLLLEAAALEWETCDALEGEHRELEAALTGGVFDRRAFYALAAHVEQEEMELFPQAMLRFEDDSWDALALAFEEVNVTGVVGSC
jgi:hypothetical protein